MILATANRLQKTFEMISRRELLLATAASVILPGSLLANNVSRNKAATISWSEFQAQMTELAEQEAGYSIDKTTIAERGMQYLKQLDISATDFKQAAEDAYETGNRYWLWQRMIKGQNINGGILNIDRDQLVQLHDHPGAIGMVRIISGETEIWQFDVVAKDKDKVEDNEELVRMDHRILKAGDMALLTPNKGNIHALRAISKECRMLDFFIPPYQRSQRSWYEPVTKNWFDKERIICKKFAQDEFTQT